MIYFCIPPRSPDLRLHIIRRAMHLFRNTAGVRINRRLAIPHPHHVYLTLPDDVRVSLSCVCDYPFDLPSPQHLQLMLQGVSPFETGLSRPYLYSNGSRGQLSRPPQRPRSCRSPGDCSPRSWRQQIPLRAVGLSIRSQRCPGDPG
jgi:hypothetical protein